MKIITKQLAKVTAKTRKMERFLPPQMRECISKKTDNLKLIIQC